MIVDAHTDVLSKLLENPDLDFYKESNELSVNYPNLLKGNVSVQVFAIFVSNFNNSKFLYALQSIDDFYQKVISDKIFLAHDYKGIEQALKENKKLAMLSLEGAEAIEGDIAKLRLLYRLGVRAIGLTWNYANEVADGISESRGAGLTDFGRKVISEMNNLGMMIDVSHISEKGFWDVMERSSKPILASHSNAKKICNHNRNLTDEQIKAIIKNDGVIGVTFVRSFTSDKVKPTIDELILHIEHIAGLGGINNIGLGSDFDGASTLIGLENASCYNNLAEKLEKKFTSEQVKGIMGDNWLTYYKKVL